MSATPAPAPGRRLLDALFWLLAALWVFGMILVPQIVMVERSLWRLERNPEAFALTRRIDELYQQIMLRELDLAHPAADQQRLQAEIAALRAEVAELEAREQTPVKIYGLDNYSGMSALHLRVFLRTLAYAALVTLLSLITCYPVAWVAAKAPSYRLRALLLLGLVIPYAINELLRVYAWLMIFDYQGVINTFLDWIGITDLAARQWIPFLEYPFATFVAMVYAYILFMVFPIYNAIQTLDDQQIEAARDLGASTWRLHWRVVIPHARPGIAVGCVMTFMLSAGSYSVPQIMTRGTGGDWFSQLIYRQFFEANNWNIGAAYAFALLVACLLFVFAVMRLFRVGIREIAR